MMVATALGCGSGGMNTTGSGGATTSSSTSSSTSSTKSSTSTSGTSTGGGGTGGATSSSSGTGGTTSSSSGTGGTTSSTSGTGGATTSSTSGTGGATTSSTSGTGGATTSTTSTTSSTGTGTMTGCTSDAQCDDGKLCNGAETCVNGMCTAGTAPSCDDGIACTTDTCDAATNACVHTADAAKCDDGVFCNGAEVCDATSGCKAGQPPVCDDGVSCTVDACDEANKTCTHTPMDSLCPGGTFCNGMEHCDAIMGCLSGTPPSCDDGVMCTQDFCDQSSDSCKHVPLDTACSNGLFCDGVEVCDPVNGAMMTGCKAGTPPNCDDGVACTVDACSNALAQCTHVATNALCDDGVFCNGQETCDATLGCKPAAAPVNCDDGLMCTNDACDEAQKKCTHTPVNAACDDGLYCNGQETCSPTGPAPSGCVAGTPPPCPSDGIACTVDACDEASKTCKHTANNALCPPGQFCVVQQNGCTAGTPCSNASQCQDGNLCNGVETCTNGICQPGTPVNCDDGIGCTVDSCNPANGQCTHATNDAFCNDGLACNGVETCSAISDCVAGTPVNCDDGVTCTVDSCNEPNGTCTHTPVDILCSDGKLCNGIETCDATKGCQPAAQPFQCPNNGSGCTTMVCDPVLNACKPIPDNSKCPCGQTCDPVQGCGNYCVVATCQGKVYQCGDCLDNDGDCKIDSADPDCLGPCSNNESGFFGNIPGQNNAPCKQDCYFDGDTGSGNDGCYWDHRCDPGEVSPNFYPEGSKCAYQGQSYKVTSTLTCSQAEAMQSAMCLGYCGPLTPNGCDCFGCCNIPVPNSTQTVTVWLGSTVNGVGSCDLSVITDPSKCEPCEQVAGCLNPCEHCELCVGKTQLPPDCIAQTCPGNTQACGLPTQPQCPTGYSCITGCCQLNPQ